MQEHAKLTAQLGAAFLMIATLLFFLERQLAGASGASRHALLYCAFLALFCLYGGVVALVRAQLDPLRRKVANLTQQLEEAKKQLNVTTSNLEQQVERRTFEFSVANASLNREIAERIQAEAETRRVQRRLHLILESAGEGIFGLDMQGKVTFVNRAAGMMLGWDPDDLVGQTHHTLIHHSYADGRRYPASACPIHQAYRDGKVHFGTDEVFWKADGSSFPVQYISTPIWEHQQLTGAVVVFRDLASSSTLSLEPSREPC